MSHDETTTAHEAYQSRTYFPELDGLRALSVLLVINVHLHDPRWRWLAGFRGVTIFFVLSGYLITMLALREEARYGRLSLAAFYVRRSFRILPLYYVTLALYCLLILGLGLSAAQRGPLQDALSYYVLYFQEVPFCHWRLLIPRDLPFAQSWTLGVEEKFYLLWPLLAFVIWRGAGRRRVLGTAMLAAAAAVVPALLTPFGPVPHVAGRMLFCYASLLAGCLLASLLHDRTGFHRLRRLRGATLPAALLLLAAHFATPWVANPSLAEDGLNILYTLAVALFLACLLVEESPIQRLLRWGPLVRLGRLSYAIYLLHMLAMELVFWLLPASKRSMPSSLLAFGLTVLLSVALAWVMHKTVESFCIRIGRHWSQRILERAAASAPRPPLPSRWLGLVRRKQNKQSGLTPALLSPSSPVPR